jgi:hypothetical protein
MVVGTIGIGVFAFALGMLIGYVSRTILVKDVDQKCEDTAKWFTEAAKVDVDAYIRERKGAILRKRILINAFKECAGKSYSEFAAYKAIVPPAFILANLFVPTINKLPVLG